MMQNLIWHKKCNSNKEAKQGKSELSYSFGKMPLEDTSQI